MKRLFFLAFLLCMSVLLCVSVHAADVAFVGGDIADYTFTYQFDGEAEISVTPTAVGSRYAVTIPDIDAKELSKSYVLTVKHGLDVLTIEYSALSYAYLLIGNAGLPSLAPAVPLAKALYLYSAAADAYAD